MKLTAQAVEDIMSDCLSPDGAPVEGILSSPRFDAARIAARAEEIAALLGELPDEFKADKGGGWTFLNACQDRNGELWTGLHSRVEDLICLGIAAGMARWMFARDTWKVLPGGVPYVVVL